MATCLEELPDLTKDGVDEEAIRAVAATIFLGGYHCHPTIERGYLTSPPRNQAGGETVSFLTW
jgi:hypothetical protein